MKIVNLQINKVKYKKKDILFVLFLLLALPFYGQEQKVRNLPYADDKWLHFGFVLGIHEQDFALKQKGNADEDGIVWRGDQPVLSPGFTVGIVSNLRLGKYWDLRCVPELEFGQRTLYFSGYKDGVKVKEINTTVMSTQLMVPISVKFRSACVNNYRPYLLAGGGVSLDISRKNDELILLKPWDLFVEFGVGCDIYLQYFKLAPELKLCVGFMDMLDRERNNLDVESDIKYTNSIDRLFSRLLVLSFNFE